MFWKKSAPAAPIENHTSGEHAVDPQMIEVREELESALEATAEILRAKASAAFPVEDEDQAAIADVFERWASHVLVRTPPPNTAGRAEGSKREWKKLGAFARRHHAKEQRYVTTTLEEMRQAIFSLVEVFSQSSSLRGRTDAIVRQRLAGLRAAVDSGSVDGLRAEAVAVAAAVSGALEAERQKADERASELRAALTSLRQELEQARREGEIDGLTRVHNRAAFNRMLERSVAFAGVLDRPLSLVLIDVDHFKQVNDRLGHPVGDRVLRAVADALVRAFPRRSDFVARYGGEEFAVLLAETSATDSGGVVGRALAAIRNLPIDVGGRRLRVTVSAGVGEVAATQGETTEELLARVDRALYASKKAGRDRFTLAETYVPSIPCVGERR